MPSFTKRDAAFAWLACLTIPCSALAGGGPENVFLVFNTASNDSRAIATHYAKLRRIPRINQLGVKWEGSREQTSVKNFRDKLLKPILKAIDTRKLSSQIDYVVYSSDFPWRIDLRGDFKQAKTDLSTAPYASLTGATFLYPFVLSKNKAIFGLRTNWYVPGGETNLIACRTAKATPSRAFSGRHLWLPDGSKQDLAAVAKGDSEQKKPAGLRYLLSTMLAVTSGRGNTVAEAREYLNRAARADAAPPRGAFYFVRHGGPRSKPRHQCYEAVAKSLRALGAEAKVIKGKMATNAPDALGLMTGTREYDLAKSRVRLQPGAIGDNLTSYGGIMTADAYQTPLSEMLRHGAAGAAGTVYEPTAVQAKFALPTLMLHYRRGCSLAEAYYQSVASPYQLLIVGDPLCQPWAKRPRIDEPNLVEGQVVSKPLILRPRIRSESGAPIRTWDLFVDGRRIARAPAGVGVRIKPQPLTPGEHEIRIVASSATAIRSQGRLIANIIVPANLEPLASENDQPDADSPSREAPDESRQDQRSAPQAGP